MSDLERRGNGPGRGGPARGYSWQAARKDNEIAVRHGAYVALPKLAADPQTLEFANAIRSAMPAYSPADEVSIELLAVTLRRVKRATAAVEQADEVSAGKPLADYLHEKATALKVGLHDWQADVLARGLRRDRGRFVRPIAGVSLPRGDGKTWLASFVGAWRLLAGRAPQHVLSAALDFEGARLTVRYARQFLQALVDRGEVVERAAGFEVPATGSLWEITSREHTASRGRHPAVVLYDELGWAQDDELFESLLSAQASVEDPLFVVTSTVGPRKAGPLWELAQRAASGDADVFFEHSTENRNPLVTAEYLERMKRLKHPVQYAREHENRWSEGEDAYAAADWVDAAMGHGWEGADLPERGIVYSVFVDIGLVHDPTVVAIGHGDADGLVYVDRLVTHQGSRRRPVDLGLLRAELRSIADVWRARVRIESWQGQTIAQDLVHGGVRADIRTPTAKTQAELWNTLAAELANGQVVLPRHERLREELLGLRVELRAGGGIRVTDRGRLHHDHAVSVAGVVEMVLETRRRWATRPLRSHVPRGRIDGVANRGGLTYADRVARLRARGQRTAARRIPTAVDPLVRPALQAGSQVPALGTDRGNHPRLQAPALPRPLPAHQAATRQTARPQSRPSRPRPQTG